MLSTGVEGVCHYHIPVPAFDPFTAQGVAASWGIQFIIQQGMPHTSWKTWKTPCSCLNLSKWHVGGILLPEESKINVWVRAQKWMYVKLRIVIRSLTPYFRVQFIVFKRDTLKGNCLLPRTLAVLYSFKMGRIALILTTILTTHVCNSTF